MSRRKISWDIWLIRIEIEWEAYNGTEFLNKRTQFMPPKIEDVKFRVPETRWSVTSLLPFNSLGKGLDNSVTPSSPVALITFFLMDSLIDLYQRRLVD